MVEQTLTHLGGFLANNFEISKKQVGYLDKEGIFKCLAENHLPLELPALTYYINSFTLTPETIGLSRRRVPPIAWMNLNRTLGTTIEPVQIKMSVSIALISNKLEDYFKGVRHYFSLLKNSSVPITIHYNNQDFNLTLPLLEIEALSTPPGGKEGKDFDRGIYFVMEGGFSIPSYLLFSEDRKLIRDIKVSFDEKGIPE